MAWKEPKSFEVGVYELSIFVFDNNEYAVKWCKENGQMNFPSEFNPQGFSARVWKRDDEGFESFGVCISVPRVDHRYSLLVHETAHATHYIHDHLCIPISEENSEGLAYLHDYIFRESAKLLGMRT
jgi:hypothetical protein